jgi:hypothetical protein
MLRLATVAILQWIRIPLSKAISRRRFARRLAAPRRFNSQELHLWRREQDLAEGVHPLAGLVVGLDAALAELIELIKIGELDFELQRRTAVATRQWHKQTRIELLALSRFDLAMDEIDRTLAVDW